MMTPTRNALPAHLNGGKGASAKDVFTQKQFARQDIAIRHVGLHSADPAASAKLYQEVFGTEIG
ncbi:MAG TPA: hypothetical protein VME86_11625 [Acidobacteriaceae bacterium]|nr:hypothetical protein [Acidobacteriaceae bacterium]